MIFREPRSKHVVFEVGINILTEATYMEEYMEYLTIKGGEYHKDPTPETVKTLSVNKIYRVNQYYMMVYVDNGVLKRFPSEISHTFAHELVSKGLSIAEIVALWKL